METIGVLLMAYGAARSLDEIEPYILDIRGGRPTPVDLVEEVREKYRRIGGTSPLIEITRRQAQALETTLSAQRSALSANFKVFIGMRHWHPYIRDVVGEIKKSGISKIVALCMTPFYSRLSVGAYFECLQEALRRHNADIQTLPVLSYHNHPLLLKAYAKNILSTLLRFPDPEPSRIHILFSAHSLPQRILQENDPYPGQILETANGILRELAEKHRTPEGIAASSWTLAYQSPGRTPEPWLGPDIAEALEGLADRGCRQILSAPIGFISDHLETLYDNDILHREQARSRGLEYLRAPSLNDSPLLIRCLSRIVQDRILDAR